MVFNTYHHTRTCLDEKIEIDEKKFQKFFSLPISLRVTLKLSLRSRFSAKKHFFVFCRNFGFNLEISSHHYSQSKKQVKVDPETRSYDFLTKTCEKKSDPGRQEIAFSSHVGFLLRFWAKRKVVRGMQLDELAMSICSRCSLRPTLKSSTTTA